jgi:hypothetical protein
METLMFEHVPDTLGKFHMVLSFHDRLEDVHKEIRKIGEKKKQEEYVKDVKTIVEKSLINNDLLLVNDIISLMKCSQCGEHNCHKIDRFFVNKLNGDHYLEVEFDHCTDTMNVYSIMKDELIGSFIIKNYWADDSDETSCILLLQIADNEYIFIGPCGIKNMQIDDDEGIYGILRFDDCLIVETTNLVIFLEKEKYYNKKTFKELADDMEVCGMDLAEWCHALYFYGTHEDYSKKLTSYSKFIKSI